MLNDMYIVKYYCVVCGFWPFTNKHISLFQQSVYFFALLSITIPCGIHLYRHRSDIDKVCESLSMGSLLPLSIICFKSLVRSRKFLKRMFNLISEDYTLISKNKHELKVFLNISRRSKLFITVYVGYTSITCVIFLIVSFLPPLIYKRLNINKTYEANLPLKMDYYYFDKNDYYVLTTIHQFTAGLYGVATVVCVDVLLFTFCLHVYGLFTVLRFKLNHIMINEETLEYLTDTKKMYRRASDCVVAYMKILKLIEEINNVFSYCLLLSIAIIILLVSFHGTVILYKLTEIRFVCEELLLAVGQLLHLFFNCFTGQLVNTQNAILPSVIYDVEWYNASPEIKTLIQIILYQSQKECNIYVGKTLVLSNDFFATIIKTIFSYLNLLNSQR
ncbi:odorant receptor 82a-like [Leptopilina heterotoma]|uniref:odorant receptor 82a-like n=1 Tax=Leptopilina heterotoma TaxID=63436 RepID=UPI001CA8A93D|nr:odorant receptor 82a-like [Leptopilina heterotoma]